MSLPGLVAANNLSDVADKEKTWDNLGNGISYTINGNTSTGVVVKGADILALNGVSSLDVSSLLYIKNLSSAAQPRLTSIATDTNSVVQLQAISMLKASPTTAGNYQINGSLTFSSFQVNGVGVGSLSTTPFTGTNATVAIHADTVAIGAEFKLNAAATSALTTPTLAIPVEVEGIYMYMKGGAS